MNRRSIAIVVAVAAIAAIVAVVLTRGGKPPVADISADRSNVFGHPALTATPPLPTGAAAASAADFARDPCAVATVDELGLALAKPFHVLSGTLLRRDRPPERTSGGCGYGYLADGTDTAETYHRVVITVKQVAQGGAKLLADCLAGASAFPHGRADVGDEACLDKGSVLVVKLGVNHYTVAVAATPVRANRTDEETELAPLIHAAAALLVTRLPSK
ncbi:hypothetical protein Rhe02_49740 [Rhizocola hellebori]|uniref:DUF3558 domain-containing protein n=1 Tax=Rhizocola hellebori TaxID=1392758 RepID=A0A8J3QBX6_9ACTN|nr:hypothetical protein [Rhizocola hellebori]GIH06907.1 hypothetical protein Rhe02_49740 [Rhizocola hellebori]